MKKDAGDDSLKIIKWPITKIVARILAGLTAISGWINWIKWLNERRKSWPKERMNTKKLHALLYRCPACGCESQMDSKGKKIFCLSCGKHWELNHQGRIRAKGGQSEYAHILDWILWERECVKEEIQKGIYYFEDTVRVEMPVKGKKSGQQGIARFTQTPNDSRLVCVFGGEEYTMIRTGKTLEKLTINYDYLGKGDCFEFPAPNGMLRCYPSKRDVVTKLAYATEEIHRRAQKKD